MALTYAIEGGADAEKFSIDATSGVLVFKSAPDFEKPRDADKNNIYQVTISVFDGTYKTTQEIAVTVANIRGR